MTLEQHFYTSGKPEFITVAITDGISREERIQLETNSIYFLPVSLHYQENITTPVKYIWYPLGQDHFAFGRGIYKGKDSLGRTGNYLFHNYVVAKDDLMAACDTNPITLIKYLTSQRMFHNDAPTQDIQPLELSSDAIQFPASGFPCIPRDLMERILYTCLEHDTLHQPLLLLGTEDESLDFLERLYMILPYDVRLALRVDTYAYGVSLGFPIIGSLDDETFSQGLTSSLTLRLSNLESTVYAEFPAPSRYLTVLAENALGEKKSTPDTLFSLEYHLKHEAFTPFKQEFQKASPEIRQLVWKFYDSQLLNHIVAEQDVELLRLIQHVLRIEHIDTLYLAPELIQQLITGDDHQNLALVAHWLCTPGTKELFYPYLFQSFELWKVWLDHIPTHPDTASHLLAPLKAFHNEYSPTFERVLSEHLLMLLPYLRENRKLAKEVSNIIEEFPSPHDISETERRYLHVLRTLIIYELTNDATLLHTLCNSDLTVLSTQQRAPVLESLLDRILVVRSLHMWNPEKAEQQIRGLLTMAAQDSGFLSDFLTAITRLQLSKEAHKLLEKVFSDQRSILIQGQEATHIQALIDRVLEPPPSFFKTLKAKVFRLQF